MCIFVWMWNAGGWKFDFKWILSLVIDIKEREREQKRTLSKNEEKKESVFYFLDWNLGNQENALRVEQKQQKKRIISEMFFVWHLKR